MKLTKPRPSRGDPKHQRSTGRPRTMLGIVRVSTRKQGDGISPDVQEAGIREYARDNGYELVAVIRVHESGKDSEKRPQFQKAFARVLAENIGHVVFWVSDRLGRNLTDFERFEREVRAGTFVLHFARDRRIFDQSTSGDNWLLIDVTASVAKHESRIREWRALEANERKANDGDYPGKAPFAFVNMRATGEDGQVRRRGGGWVEPADWATPLIPRIFQLVSEGVSFRLVCQRVLEEGLVPEHKVKFFTRPGAPGRVQRIVRDVFYRGEFDWGGKRYSGNHQALVTRAQWDAAQPENAESGKVRKWKRDSALAGFLSCAECGCQITYDPKTKKTGKFYAYYRCANGKRQHERLTYVREEDILAAFAEAVSALRFEPDWFELISQELNQQHTAHKESQRAQMKHFKEALNKLQDREDNLYDDRAAGLVDDDGYRRQLQRVRDERARLTEALETASEQDGDRFLVSAQRTLELARRAKNTWDAASPKEKRRLLEILVSNPQLRGRSVEYSLQKPFRILAEMAKDPDWRAREDSNL